MFSDVFLSVDYVFLVLWNRFLFRLLCARFGLFVCVCVSLCVICVRVSVCGTHVLVFGTHVSVLVHVWGCGTHVVVLA